MTMDGVHLQLTDEQYTKLTNGEHIEAEANDGEDVYVVVTPPCSVRGHDWGGVSIDNVNQRLERKCSRCGKTGYVELEDNEMLDTITHIVE